MTPGGRGHGARVPERREAGHMGPGPHEGVANGLDGHLEPHILLRSGTNLRPFTQGADEEFPPFPG